MRSALFTSLLLASSAVAAPGSTANCRILGMQIPGCNLLSLFFTESKPNHTQLQAANYSTHHHPHNRHHHHHEINQATSEPSEPNNDDRDAGVNDEKYDRDPENEPSDDRDGHDRAEDSGDADGSGAESFHSTLSNTPTAKFQTLTANASSRPSRGSDPDERPISSLTRYRKPTSTLSTITLESPTKSTTATPTFTPTSSRRAT